MEEHKDKNGIAPLLERAYMFLADGNFDSADEYAEKILDAEPKNPEAYICKLLAEFKAENKDSLRFCGEDISKSANYKKAHDFGDEKCREYLASSLKTSLDIKGYNERIESAEKAIEDKNKEIETFSEAAGLMAAGQKNINGIIKRCRKWAAIYFVAFGLLLLGIAMIVLDMTVLLDTDVFLLLLLALVLMLIAMILMIVSYIRIYAIEEIEHTAFNVIFVFMVFCVVGIFWGFVIAIMQFAKKKVNYSSSAEDFMKNSQRSAAELEELKQNLQKAQQDLQIYIEQCRS